MAIRKFCDFCGAEMPFVTASTNITITTSPFITNTTGIVSTGDMCDNCKNRTNVTIGIK